MNILIVKLSSIGDVIHTLPVLPAIHSAIPGAKVSWVVERSSAEILRGNKEIDQLIEIDTRSIRTSKTLGVDLAQAKREFAVLRQRAFDVSIDFQGLFKSAVAAKISRSKKRYGFARPSLREPASRFLFKRSVAVPENIHVIRKNLALLAGALKITVPDTAFEFPISTDDKHKLEAGKIVEQIEGDFVILNPAGGWATKLWPAENYGLLADRLWERHRLRSVISLGPREGVLGNRALEAAKVSDPILATPTLKGFFELAKAARLYVGGDTGPTHLAAAAKTPIVGIFGPTEWWRNGSTDPMDICVERTDIGCRINCHRRTCSKWICMDIDVDTVLKAVEKRLRIGS